MGVAVHESNSRFTLQSMSGNPVTSYDVAKRAGVSQSTVSRALRGDVRVVVETRDRIREIASEMGYVPHIMARSLITRKSSSIAIISGDLRNPSYPTLVNTLQSEFARDNYRVLLMSDRTEGDHENDVLALRGGLVDGVIFNSARIDSPMIGALIEWNIPVVVLTRDVDAQDASRVDRVTSDNIGGGRLIADLLVDLGHKRIGVVGGPLDNPSVQLRERGFRDGLASHGVELDESLVLRGVVDPSTGLDIGRTLLGAPEPPTAVFCATDYMAMGMLDAANRCGRRVPEDVQVVGYNDLDMASWSMFDLTTVRQPLEDMARAAAKRLLARIDGDRSAAVHQNFGVTLVERGTTAPVA